MLCLRHPVWSKRFFTSDLDSLRSWLGEKNQPLLRRFSLAQLTEMDEMILPTEKEEVVSEYSKLMFQQELNYLELTDPEFERFSDDPVCASKIALMTVMTTRKRNQMMMTKYLSCPELELPEPDLLYPLCLYGQLVKFMGEENLFLTDDSVAQQDMRLLVRPLLWYTSLYDQRRDFVEVVASVFRPVLEANEHQRANIVELERHISTVAWELMFEQFPTFCQVKHYLNYYDMVKNSVLGYILSDSPHRRSMRLVFMRLLFFERDFALLTSNAYMILNPDAWQPVVERENRAVETIKLEPNSDLYSCPRCKKNRCYVESKQTRSADEAATIFVTCVECFLMYKAHN